MDRKGFTVIELLAVIIVLGVILGVTLLISSNVFKEAKYKSEEVFIESLKDAIDIYISDNSDNHIEFNSSNCKIPKKSSTVSASIATIHFEDIVNSNVLTAEEFINPIDKNLECILSAEITLYRDENFVYYYKFSKSSLGCLTNYNNTDISDSTEEGKKMRESNVSTLPRGAIECDD